MGFGEFFSEVADALQDAVGETNEWLSNNTASIDPFHSGDEVEYEDGQLRRTGRRIGDAGFLASAREPVVGAARTFHGGVEKTMAAWNWVYSNAVSQPLSTVGLMANQGLDEQFSASAWTRAWNAAEHISWGQAVALNYLDASGNFDLDSDRAERRADLAIASPLAYYEPSKAELPPEIAAVWDDLTTDEKQRILKEAGMPAVGNRYVAQLQEGSRVFDALSGSLDFGGRMFLDPLIIGGKVLGVARRAALVKPRPKGGWSSADIDELINKSAVSKAIDDIWANVDNPQMLNNLDIARKSSIGPRFGNIASTLKSRGEVALFIRAGMGDVRAIRALEKQNTLAAARMQADSLRLTSLGLQRNAQMAAGNPAAAAVIQRHMKFFEDRLNADDALVNRYSSILSHADELDELRLTRWSVGRAERRTKAQNAYRAGPARGNRATRPRMGGAPGYVKTRIWGMGDWMSTPVTVVRAMREAHPNGTMRLDDLNPESIAELRGHLARIPNIRPETRAGIVNQYLKTQTEGERRALAKYVDQLAVERIAKKHGLPAQAAQDIYKEHSRRLQAEILRLRNERYSAAWKHDPAQGRKIRVDEWTDASGAVQLDPFTVSRLVNSHIFMPLDDLDKVLARHSSFLRALYESRLGGVASTDWIKSGGEAFTQLWKFTTLFRLGYLPRAIGDELVGQWAAAGSAAMALRIGWGVKNGSTNLARRAARPWAEAQEKMGQQELAAAQADINLLRPQMTKLQGRVTAERAQLQRRAAAAQRRRDAAATKLAAYQGAPGAPKQAALQRLLVKREQELLNASKAVSIGPGSKNIQFRDMERQMAFLEDAEKAANQKIADMQAFRAKRMQGMTPVEIGGRTFPAAFMGERGQYWMAQISADESMKQLLNSSRQLLQGNLERSFNHGGEVITMAQGEKRFLEAWSHALNAQMGQDALQRLALEGKSVQEMVEWLTRDPAGRAYRRRLGQKMRPVDDIAHSAHEEVAQYAPDPLIRAAALKGEATPDFLKTAIPNPNHRPYEVHTGRIGVSQNAFLSTLDRVQQSFYKNVVTIPTNRLSRHPLYNQLYEGHLKIITNTRAKQGLPVNRLTVKEVDHVTEIARRLAAKDMRRLVFDITHRSDAASALRMISPFFSATAESFQRWARIIADKPETVGYAANFFNAPASLGALQDLDGNDIHPDGFAYTTDPKTGKAVKRFVPKSERYIVTRMPKWFANSPLGVAFGVDPASRKMTLSQNSVNMVTQGDPWFNPGVGPIVAIPVNEWVKDKPSQAELARHLGVLPFGPQMGTGLFGDNVAGRAFSTAAPGTLKNFLTAFDTTDARYQRVKLHIMQSAIYEHEELGKPMLSREEIADRTRNYWLFSAATAFLQPAATQRKDKYQFYRDQYNALRRKDPLRADEEFLSRFGESYFIFAQAESKNESGIPATRKAVELQKKYGAIIAANPELGALVVGPEGNGPFSPEAYSYQLHTPLIPGDSEMQRRKMSAEEAIRENNRRRGWAKFTQVMNYLRSQLHGRGLTSFADAGAEDLASVKRGYTLMLSEPLKPDGTPNPYYNEEWSKDFLTFDTKKYDRIIPGLTELARSPLADEPHRTDLRVLRRYLGGRQGLLQELAARGASGGAKTLRARANADLRDRWVRFVDGLIESDTRFGDLHTYYLSRDLGVDVEGELEAEEATA